MQSITSRDSWARFNLIGGDIKDIEICMEATKDVDYVLHQAALGSVPRSIHDPINSNMSNVSGFLNMLTAQRKIMSRALLTRPVALPMEIIQPSQERRNCW